MLKRIGRTLQGTSSSPSTSVLQAQARQTCRFLVRRCWNCGRRRRMATLRVTKKKPERVAMCMEACQGQEYPFVRHQRPLTSVWKKVRQTWKHASFAVRLLHRLSMCTTQIWVLFGKSTPAYTTSYGPCESSRGLRSLAKFITWNFKQFSRPRNWKFSSTACLVFCVSDSPRQSITWNARKWLPLTGQVADVSRVKILLPKFRQKLSIGTKLLL